MTQYTTGCMPVEAWCAWRVSKLASQVHTQRHLGDERCTNAGGQTKLLAMLFTLFRSAATLSLHVRQSNRESAVALFFIDVELCAVTCFGDS